MDQENNNKKNISGKVGTALGATAGVIGTVMSNPIGKWLMFTSQDEAGLKVHHLAEDIFKKRAAGDTAYRIFNFITNTIMAYPAILPIAGGLLAAGLGSIVGKKIANSKLNHKSLKVKEKTSVR